MGFPSPCRGSGERCSAARADKCFDLGFGGLYLFRSGCRIGRWQVDFRLHVLEQHCEGVGIHDPDAKFQGVVVFHAVDRPVAYEQLGFDGH